MHQTKTCLECSGYRFAVRVLYDSNARPLSVMPCHSSGGQVGRFEAWICLACGYTAIYARGLPGNIEQFAEADPDELRIVDHEPRKQGPHR